MDYLDEVTSHVGIGTTKGYALLPTAESPANRDATSDSEQGLVERSAPASGLSTRKSLHNETVNKIMDWLWVMFMGLAIAFLAVLLLMALLVLFYMLYIAGSS